MAANRKHPIIHLLFLLSVIGKAVDGVLEVVGGMLLLVTSSEHIHHIVRFLTRDELSDDPNDLIANYLLHATHHLSMATRHFASAYLLVHGVIKIGLVAGLLRRRHWAYPLAIIAFCLFVVYQLYRYTDTGSPDLLALSALDVLVIILTWLEYQRLKATHGFARTGRRRRLRSVNAGYRRGV